MKIEPGSKQVAPASTVDSRATKTQANKPADGGQTSVSLSPQAAELKALETQLAAIPVVDRAHVDSVKAAISSGQYKINTENISNNLIDSVKELLHVAK
jgi:negative regulator of flagellin synthesis FlgM